MERLLALALLCIWLKEWERNSRPPGGRWAIAKRALGVGKWCSVGMDDVKSGVLVCGGAALKHKGRGKSRGIMRARAP